MPPAEPTAELSVTCLCAEWCDVCREYRPAFEALAQHFPRARFAWLDVEDDAEEVGEREIENFPTIEVRRGDMGLNPLRAGIPPNTNAFSM